MQATQAATMPRIMPDYASGDSMRRKILLALLARQPRTIRGLALAVGTTDPNALKHVRRMVASGLLSVETIIGRRGSKVTLADAGQAAARLLPKE